MKATQSHFWVAPPKVWSDARKYGGRTSLPPSHLVAGYGGILAPLPALDRRPPKQKNVNQFAKNLVSKLSRRTYTKTHFIPEIEKAKGALPAARPRGFTLLELLIVIAVIGILAALLLPALSKARQRGIRADCVNNLRQVTMLLTMYADSNNELLPHVSTGHWAWDVPRSVADRMVEGGISPMVFFCKGCGFTESDFYAQWNEFISTPPTTNDYRVVGYAMTFPGTASVLFTNQNASILPQVITDPDTGISYPAPPASDRVLAADATISQPTEDDVADRSSNVYVNIIGAYIKPHQTAHLNGNYPAGGNLGMLDGHVEWRNFQYMYPRTDSTLGDSPVFWW